MKLNQLFEEKKDQEEIVADIVTKMDDHGIDTEVYDSGKNFNVSFKVGDTEYYIRPNDKGDEMFYIDADIDDFDTIKVKDMEALAKKVKGMMKDED